MSSLASTFASLDYLKNGNTTQQRIYTALKDEKVFERLKGHTPLLAGTYPLEINIAGSDLDILCFSPYTEKFILVLKENFGHKEEFVVSEKELGGLKSVICRFRLDEFDAEIVGQPIPVTKQVAFRHMVVEAKILAAEDGAFRAKIIELKESGIKTEPAFAILLGLEGDPYQALLDLESKY